MACSCSFTENLLKRSHLGKEHVPESPPHMAVVTVILGPEIIIDELVDFHAKIFQGQLGGDGLLYVRGCIASQLNLAQFASPNVVAEAVTQQAIVILHFRLKQHLLQGRDLLVATREDESDFRRQVALHHKLKLRLRQERAVTLRERIAP